MFFRTLATGTKYLAAALLTLLLFAGLTAVCIARDCTCVIRRVDGIDFSDTRVSRLAVNPTTGLLYVSADDDMEITVYDTARLEAGPLARVPTDGYHGGLAVDDRANKIYVVQSFARRVRVIDGATHTYHDLAVPGLINAMGSVAVDPRRQRLYVFRSDNLDIAVFDSATEAFVGAIGEGCCSSPGVYLAVNPVSGLLLAVESASKQVMAFDEGGRKVATIPVGDVPAGITIDVEAQRAYVANSDSRSVSVIDVAPERHTAFNVVDKIILLDHPTDLAVDPAARRVYSIDNLARKLSVIDLSGPSVGRHVKDLELGDDPGFIALDPVTSRGYVSLGANVAVVQGCPAPRRAEAAERHAAVATAQAAAATAPPDPTAAARRRAFVRCNRMFRIRTNCITGPDVQESALARATIEASGARVADEGSAGQFCGVAPDNAEPYLAAAGLYYSVPVLAPGASTPAVWTFHSTTRTIGQATVPTGAALARVTEPPSDVWQEALWYLSRCQAGAAEACCEHLP